MFGVKIVDPSFLETPMVCTGYHIPCTLHHMLQIKCISVPNISKQASVQDLESLRTCPHYRL